MGVMSVLGLKVHLLSEVEVQCVRGGDGPTIDEEAVQAFLADHPELADIDWWAVWLILFGIRPGGSGNGDSSNPPG